MAALREYILSVVAAAILCGIVSGLAGKKANCAPILKLVCGIFLTLTVVRPIVKVDMDEIGGLLSGLQTEAEAASAFGEEHLDHSLKESIKQATQAYILDKAGKLGLELTVSVHLDEENIPDEVILEGACSPYGKRELQSMIVSDLGIPKERQIWIG